MRDFRSVLNVIGLLLCIEAIALLIPMLIDLLYQNPDWEKFLFSSIITFFIGLVLYFSFKKEKIVIKIRQAFLLTILSWIIIAVFASLPFIFSSANLNYTDAFFESISGITTTGATVINNLDELNEGILIWRSLLQWFGGIGIIVLAMAILPTLQIGGMQLLHMEQDDPYEKTLPKINHFIIEIFSLYLVLTIICALLYYLFGMNGFDAISHSMTTISTGGFSSHNSSFAFFDSASIETISIIFMIVGSLPFVIYLKFMHGDRSSIIKDDQIRLFTLIIILLIVLTTLWLQKNSLNEDLFHSFRLSAFNITSILTGTGYTSTNYNAWGSFGLVIMIIIMFIGGCAGSTTGGIKIFRLQLLFRGAKTQIKKLTQPHGVFLTSFNGKSVTDDTFNSIMGFFFMYILIFILSSIALSFFNIDFLTAFSAAASAISNVGPGLG
ncbi:TrkH family potassium uptake protein, partial [Alphaproteobacteria bacterium]|nr:TrkH family potassium uptake protein [Alphaproteobacteria bacterium]